MRLSLVTVVLSALAASATLMPRQSPFPACATPCVTTVVQSSGSTCSVTDNNCLCHDQKFITASTQCILANCSGSDLQDAVTAAQKICAAYGVNPVTGTVPAASSGSITPTATHPATSSHPASSAPAPTTSKSAAGSNYVANGLAGFVSIVLTAIVI